ncbi:MAG TPA: class II fructose-1,6-bisphosphate aldolase [Acholeplasmataceae bacterium]|nr:class II fructose-1,6-bisphosphate aldolase [Acholeplasmataceae bacterium]
MALVNMTAMLNKAKDEKYAVGQFNINNLEWTKIILETAQAQNSPVILGVSQGAAKYMGGFTTVVNMVKGLIHDLGITVDVAIHLDHGSSKEVCIQAIDAGFTSVMIDASHFPLEDNIAITKAVVEYAHPRGVSVEAELGTVGGQEEHVVGSIIYADKNECVKLVQETNIDCLAPALGSVHGPYKGEPVLGFKEMEEIFEATQLPLVLHGGTGIPDDLIKRAIALGTAKINVNTECQMAFSKTVREIVASDAEVYDPRKILGPASKSIGVVVAEKMRVFGSVNKN